MHAQQPIHVIVCGIAGRMGQAVVAAAALEPCICIVGGVVRPSSALAGKKRAGESSSPKQNIILHTDLAAALAVSDCPPRKKNDEKKTPPLVVVDFSAAACCMANAKACQEAKVPYLVCTTGLGVNEKQALQAAAKSIAVMHAPNTSSAANALHVICQLAARLLPQADIEICETHHRAKADAPSGTALWLAEGMAQARGWNEKKSLCTHARQGKRNEQEIGIVSLRGGSERGSHTVHLLAEDESLEITQRAVSRAAYARGALRAARFLAAQFPGHHTTLGPS